MVKKFFSLIHGGDLAIAPDVKHIPATEFSTLLEGKELLDKVKADEQQYRLEVIESCEKIREAAAREGYRSGFQAWCEKLAELETEIERVHGELQKILAPAAIRAAKKLIGRELSLNPATVVDIVAETLRSVAQHRRVTIYANRHDLEELDKQRERLRAIFERIEVLALAEDNNLETGCFTIETDMGIVNASIDRKWETLERTFEKFLVQPTHSVETS